MDQQIRFCTTADGVRIAYCVMGQGPPLVFVRGWTSHLHVFWDDPHSRAYFQALAEAFTVVRFDMRSNGLSDRNVGVVDLEAMVRDLETVVDALSLPRVVLYGQCFGGPAAIAYAAAHPDRVTHLILDGTNADGRRIARPEQQARLLGTLRDLPEAGRLLMSHYTYPGMGDTWPRLLTQRTEAMDREMALQLYSLCYRFDVTDLLPYIASPTLVMHRRRSRAIPFRLGRELASCIGGARFVELAGAAHNPWHEGPAEALAAIGAFLGVPLRFVEATDNVNLPAGSARTFVVAEVVLADATAPLDEAESHKLIATSEIIVSDALRDFGGDQITQTGAGVLATFASASRAVECAAGLQRTIAARKSGERPLLSVRIGINAGESHAAARDRAADSIQLAMRVCASAAPGTILLTGVVRDLCAGKVFRFEDRGVLAMGDGDEPTRFFELCWRESPSA